MRATMRLAAAMVGCFAGCGRAPTTEDLLAEVRHEYGGLPQLKCSTDPALRDEYQRLLEERGTPEDLILQPALDRKNAAPRLVAIFPPARAVQIIDLAEPLSPQGELPAEPEPVARAREFIARYKLDRAAARSALEMEHCDYEIDHAAGRLADLSFMHGLLALAQIEKLTAAVALADGELTEALTATRSLFRLADTLEDEAHVVPRLQAAHIRREAFRALAGIVQHDAVERRHVEELLRLLHAQLETWSGDDVAWRGERAQTLHAYEMIRAGHLLTLLDPAQVEALRKRDLLALLLSTEQTKLDADQHFYMSTMRELITACERPFYLRHEVFLRIEQELNKRSGTSDFPYVAMELFLGDVRQGMQIQARDRGRCEAWALALAAALEASHPEQVGRNNPLTGRAYEVEVLKDRVVVRSGIPGEVLVVPQRWTAAPVVGASGRNRG